MADLIVTHLSTQLLDRKLMGRTVPGIIGLHVAGRLLILLKNHPNTTELSLLIWCIRVYTSDRVGTKYHRIHGL